MHAVAEGQCGTSAPRDVKVSGRWWTGVAFAAPVRRITGASRRNRTSGQFDWSGGEPPLVLRRRVHPEDLLDSVGYQRPVVLHELPLFGVLVEEDDATTDQLGFSSRSPLRQ